MDETMIIISIFAFVWVLLKTRSIQKTLDILHAMHGPDFEINLYFKRIYCLRSRKAVEKVWASKPRTLYGVFSSAHPYKHTIDMYQETDPEWKIIHKAVKKAIVSLGNRPIQRLCDLFETKVRENFGKGIDVLVIFNDVYDEWYYETMVGHNTRMNQARFYSHRKTFLNAIKYSFYGNPFRKVPVLGTLVSMIRCRYGSRGFNAVERDIMSDLLCDNVYHTDLPNNTFLSKFYAALEEVYADEVPWDKSDDSDNHNHKNKINELFIENAVLSLLVYDFVELMLKSVLLAKISKAKQSTNSLLTADDLHDIYRHGFLFQVRPRVLTRSVEFKEHTMKANSYILADLVHASLFYASGPRGCAGQVLAKPLILGLVTKLNAIHMLVKSDDRVVNSDPDTPFITGSITCYMYYRDSLNTSDMIPMHTVHETGQIMRNLWHLYANPGLNDMMSIWLKLVIADINTDLSDDDGTGASGRSERIDSIFAPEARALPLASMICTEYSIPMFVLTKDAKFGPTTTEEYTRGYRKDSTIINLYHSTGNVINDSNIGGCPILNSVLIDDGIASGGTLIASAHLIERHTQVRVSAYVGIINHTYCETDANLLSKSVYTMFDF